MPTSRYTKLHLILTVSAAVLALSACKPASDAAMTSDSASMDIAYDEALPLTTDAVDTGAAPEVEHLPAAPATKVVYVDRPDDAYEYVDDAYALNDAFADAPPDYGFDYDGVHPWAWRAANDALRLVEPTSSGDRYYYYQPGARDPYLVRDSGYSYAYSGGRLVAVYDSRGQTLAEAQARQRAEWAGRYLARARALESASRDRHREQVQAQAWAKRQVAVEQAQAQWREQQHKNQAWQQWRKQHDQQDRWEQERRRRQQAAADFRTWRQHDYRGPAPVVVAVHPDHGARLAAADARREQMRIDAQKRDAAIHKAHQQQARADAAKDRHEDAADRKRAHDKAVAAQKQQQARKKAADAKALAQQNEAEHRKKAGHPRRAHADDKAPAVAANDGHDRDGDDDGGH